MFRDLLDEVLVVARANPPQPLTIFLRFCQVIPVYTPTGEESSYTSRCKCTGRYPDTLDVKKLGLSYDALRKVPCRLVYARARRILLRNSSLDNLLTSWTLGKVTAISATRSTVDTQVFSRTSLKERALTLVETVTVPPIHPFSELAVMCFMYGM